jgi:hypothetical protein
LGGLNWVFLDRGPRTAAQNAQCQDIALGERTLHRQCFFQYEGAPVCIDWSQFVSFPSGRSDYDHLGAPVSQPLAGGGTQLVWGPRHQYGNACQGLPYKTAKMVAGELWGIATYSTSPSVAADAQRYFGEFRPRSEWSGISQS